MGLRELAEKSHADASSELDSGQVPANLVDAVAAQLTVAGRQLSKGNATGAARFYARAVELAFHRGPHFDGVQSPLAADATGFVAPLRESAVAQRLREPRGRHEAARPLAEVPRITLLTRGNANFLREIAAVLEKHPEAEVRLVDLLGDQALSKGLFNAKYLAEQILTNGESPTTQESILRRAERALRPILDESDVVWVDWCTTAAVLLNLVDPGSTRVVIRLHSYEAFTHWPHLIDWSRVDDLVFVSEHLRDLAVDAIPGLTEEHAPRMHVLPLNRDLQPYVRPKQSAGARFELALVGWGSVAKDPRWAFEVLRELRKHDDRYRLLLVGSEFDGTVSAFAQRYAEELAPELAALEKEGAVVRAGQTDDVPGALTEVGVILSTSVRESFHAAVVEGTASGAVPVVRDWPFCAHRATGARSLYPADWVVSTPEEAAQRILVLTQDEATWREAGREAQELTMRTWDWLVMAPAYERFLLGDAAR